MNSRGGLDLVFVIDASSSVRKLTDFKNGLEFAKELVRTIGTSNRYDQFLRDRVLLHLLNMLII